MNVRPGDRVRDADDKVYEVVRVTPTGQVVTRRGTAEQRWTASGRAIGDDDWRPRSIYPLTANDATRILRRRRGQLLAAALQKLDLKALDDDALMKLYEAVRPR